MKLSALSHQLSAAIVVGVAAVLLCGNAFGQDAKPVAKDAKTPAGPVGNIQTGKKLFLADGCYECHGTVAQGSPRTGPTLLTALPFAAFVKQLRRPVTEMPPYEANVVSDQQAADIYAYIQTLPRPADYKTIKLLQ